MQLQARNRDVAVETAVLAQSRAQSAPDPDAPTGPPPTFDVTPLEANAAALKAVPPHLADPDPRAEASEPAPQQAAEGSAEADPQPQAASEPETAAPAAKAQTKSEPAPQPEVKVERAVAHAASDWQATSDTTEPSLDVVR